MDEYGPTASPQHGGASRRLRRRFDEHDHEPRMTVGEARIADAVQRAVDERLTDGLAAIDEQAADLMREVAGEIWRASGADARPEQERIVSLLSRDQAIRSLLATSDERFQALAMRAERLEDSLTEVTENGRVGRESMEVSVAAIRAIADSPTLHGVEAVRSQLEQVEHHIAAAFQHFDERDRTLTEDVLGQVKANSELMANETTRLVGSMQEYVQTGAEAIAVLAQRIELQAEAFTVQDITISDHVGQMVASEIRPVAEQLEMLSEKVGLHGRDQSEVRAALERLLEARIMGLARLIRSDSEALRGVVDSRAEERSALEERMLAHIDDRMTAIARLIRSDNQALATTLGSHDAAQTADAVDPELLRQTVRAIKELQAGLASDVQSTVEHRFQTMSDQLHKETQSTTESMVKVAEVLGEKIDRLSVRVDEGYGNDLQVVIDRMGDAIQAMSSVRRPA
jgi:hypothetical protein